MGGGDKRSVKLEELTWVEAERVFKEYEVVLIPLGARTKEHGPHMPLNTDWLMAEYLAERVAAEVPVVVMPTIQYGYYPAFLEYPGSVSIDREIFKEFVKGICLSLARHGVRKLYILNTGVSTLQPLKEAAEELISEGIRLRYTDISEVGREVRMQVQEQEGGTHADELETSVMLYIKPEVVDMSRAVKDYHPLGGRGLTRNPKRRDAGAYSPTGIFGDPTLASREKGRLIIEAMIRDIVSEINELIEE